MSNVGYATVSIIPSAKGFGSALNKEIGPHTARSGKDAGKKAGEGFKGAFSGSIKGMGGAVTAVLGTAAIGGFLKDAVGQASDLNEVGTALKTVFGSGLKQVEAFGATGAGALGMSRLEALKAAQTFGVYGKAAGLSDKANASFSTGLASLGTDLASFYNTSPAEAIEAIGSGLRGEAEPLRKYGVMLDDATMRQQALKMGLIKTTKEALTPQQKILAAQALIMDKTKIAQGDFAKTSGGLANQQRILAARFTDLKGSVGAVFLPVVTKATSFLADFVGGMQDGTGVGGKLADVFKRVASTVQGFIADFKSGDGAAGALRDRLEEVRSKVSGFITDFQKGEGAAGKFRSVIEATGRALQVAGQWISDNRTLVAGLATAVLGGVAAFKAFMVIKNVIAAVKAARVAMLAFNASMLANPIGIVVVALGALVAGFIYAYKNSQTFRDIVNNVWDSVKIGALYLALAAVKYFRLMSTVWFTVVGALVAGAAKAFGWVPGLGPKLRAASDKFNEFKNRSNTALSKVEKSLTLQVNTATAEARINDLRRRAAARITAFFDVTTRMTGRVNVNGVATNAGMREHGGPVTKGRTYVVGEKRPELFTPTQNGRIVPKVGNGSGSAPLIGSLTLASTGDTKGDLDETLFQLRRINRGGRYA